jgi:pilus assembly protein CpaC
MSADYEREPTRTLGGGMGGLSLRWREARIAPSLRRILAIVLAALVGGAGPVMSGGLPGDLHAASPGRNRNTILVPLNKSRIIDLRSPVARVSVANPAIADILVVNPKQIYLVGKELGTTNMILWDEDDRVQDMMGLEVTHDLQTLKEKLFRFLPDERIRVESAQGAIVLSGEVSSPKKMNAALRLAETYASNNAAQVGNPGAAQPNVLNLLQVGGAQQVLLEVRVAEIARTFLRRLDIDFHALYNGGSVKIGAVNGGASFPDADFIAGGRVPVFPFRFGKDGVVGPVIPEFNPNDAGIDDKGIFANFLGGNFFFNLVLDAAKDQGLAKLLAEPNLTTLSGEEARFLAGGEFPVPVPQTLGNVTIEFKDFGVGLVFVPLVLDSGLISLKVNVSVSELSNENAVTVPAGASTFIVPALAKRSANSSVEVPSGQTIAIAGLLNENLREGVSKFPVLGDLPIVGPLFRSQEFQKGQTELVIFVTPKLARSYRPELVKLPTDDFVEPNDTEFYLLGRLQGRKPGTGSHASSSSLLGPDKTGSEGHFGHDL